MPFCGAKCDYCSFYSVPQASRELVDSYFKKLDSDVINLAPSCGTLSSVYVGGGTPTWLPVEKLKHLFRLISGNFAISKIAEISIECNPETLDSEKTAVIANFANRISLGIQSFNPKFRSILGRKGSQESIFKAVELLKKERFDNFGCDLIYGIPGQTLNDWEKELDSAAALSVKHISAYCLTVEEGTVLAGKLDTVPDDDLSAEMWEFAGDFLAKKGFNRYEISNYSIPGYECRHNLDIWFGGTYLGLGPAASSFDGKKRFTNVPDINSWLKGADPEIDEIPPESRAREILVMGLRTSRGWERSGFMNSTGYDWTLWKDAIQKLAGAGFVEESCDILRCTKKGLLFWNEVAEKLI